MFNDIFHNMNDFNFNENIVAHHDENNRKLCFMFLKALRLIDRIRELLNQNLPRIKTSSEAQFIELYRFIAQKNREASL